jgi:uncharacterized protein involved in exopolysaccharide biosynthesis
MRWPKPALRLAGFAVGFCILGIAISLVLPGTYTSIAVLRIAPPMVPASVAGRTPSVPDAGKFLRLKERVLSRAMLEGMIANPALGLEERRRSHEPKEEIVIALRREIHIRVINASQSAFSISFSDSDPEKAQAVVRHLVARLTEENIEDERAQARASGDAKRSEIAERQLGSTLEVLDPPSLPERPVSPNRPAISFAGFAFGGLLGSITLYLGRHRAATPRSA